MKILTKLGERIRRYRLMKGLTQENMADELGISTSAYSNMENGKTDMKISRLQQIAKTLEIPLEELVKLEETGNITINSPQNSPHSCNGHNVNVTQNIPPEAFQQLEQTVRNLEKLFGLLMEKMDKEEKAEKG